jgi:hypothetical protein
MTLLRYEARQLRSTSTSLLAAAVSGILLPLSRGVAIRPGALNYESLKIARKCAKVANLCAKVAKWVCAKVGILGILGILAVQ